MRQLDKLGPRSKLIAEKASYMVGEAFGFVRHASFIYQPDFYLVGPLTRSLDWIVRVLLTLEELCTDLITYIYPPLLL